MIGRVLLVGAGPGDPELLTLRAVHALAEADLVLYDALVDPRVLAYAPRAARFCVGKRAGRASITQDTIHALLLRAARAGRTVVRLKAGDPFVLGRGGEEAMAMSAAGIPVEVIPGVSSAVAGPAAVGIPVTHRSVASGFLVLSAVPHAECTRVLLALPACSVTLVLLMAMGERSHIAAALGKAGWSAQSGSAIVMGAHTPRQWCWMGTLGELAGVEPPAAAADLPGLVVVGPVVELSHLIQPALFPAEKQFAHA